MDRSTESIGSCSLDVDPDSSDISDMSETLNLLTSSSAKKITQEFTENMRERCSARSVETTIRLVESAGSKVRVELSKPSDSELTADTLLMSAVDTDLYKKPSYLNLACCVNGYSNLTTYDSKIRQDINKSREVSPIRPSTSSIRCCKNSNTLTPPVLLNVDNINNINKPRSLGKYEPIKESNKNNYENGHCAPIVERNQSHEEPPNTSFIQQRVERLYGPAALAQNFYSPKKLRGKSSIQSTGNKNGPDAEVSVDLANMFKQLSTRSSDRASKLVPPAVQCSEDNNVDLPVLRHLSQEFRAQLLTISPKKKDGSNKELNFASKTMPPKNMGAFSHSDVVDHKVASDDGKLYDQKMKTSIQSQHTEESNTLSETKTSTLASELNGNYFMVLLKAEQNRLLSLAAQAEKYVDTLADNPEATEDTLGLLRSASGKARLLVSQKMKQFEDLCHNNLNHSPGQERPTTGDDLQGFWDMINLQIDHVDSIFAGIETLKKNDWKVSENDASSTKPKGVSTTKHSNRKAGHLKTKTVSGNTVPAAVSDAALKREAQRKKLQEMKRQRKIEMSSVDSVQIFVNDNSS